MKILVAGAAGVVGRILVPKLVQAGHEVIGMTHKEENKRNIEAMGANAVSADAFDRESMFSVLDEVRPEVVIHQLTSLGSRNFSDNSKIRMMGTRNLVDAALAAGVKRMITQSISWAYEPGDVPASEEVPLDILSDVPSRKSTVAGVQALELATAEIPHHIVLRYGMFYGPGTWYDHEGFISGQLRNNELSATHGITSFLHIEDAANAALLALDWPAGTVNIVDNEPSRGVDWLPVFAETIGCAPPPMIEGGHSAWERGASNTKARKEYGWEPIYPTWRSGFAQGQKAK